MTDEIAGINLNDIHAAQKKHNMAALSIKQLNDLEKNYEHDISFEGRCVLLGARQMAAIKQRRIASW